MCGPRNPRCGELLLVNDSISLFYSPTIDDKGIIGANPGNQFNISGVAYGSSLSAYRVFGCTGSVTDDSKSPAFIVHIYNSPFST
jgi:hypothetical protein